MYKKIICAALSALLLTGCTGCTGSAGSADPADSSGLKKIAEIRAETENISVLDAKFDNLDLSETFFYVPDVDELGGFSIAFEGSADDKEKLFFDTVERLTGEAPDESGLSYFSRSFETIPYAEGKDDPKRDEKNYSVGFENGKIYAVLEFWNKILDIGFLFRDYDSVPMTDSGSYEWLFGVQDKPVREYDLRAGENAEAPFELQGGEITVADAVGLMKSELEALPFHIDGLTLLPSRARVFGLGERYAVNALYFYEYNGVILDYHTYGYDLESGEYDRTKTDLFIDTSMARNDRIDQLYYTRFGTLTPTDESYDEFVSLERFLSMTSEKLTGRGRSFKIDTVELLYGLDTVLPEEYYTAATEEEKTALGQMPLAIVSRPMWVAYLSHTGIHEAEQMCVSADAVTGELKLHGSSEW